MSGIAMNNIQTQSHQKSNFENTVTYQPSHYDPFQKQYIRPNTDNYMNHHSNIHHSRVSSATASAADVFSFSPPLTNHTHDINPLAKSNVHNESQQQMKDESRLTAHIVPPIPNENPVAGSIGDATVITELFQQQQLEDSNIDEHGESPAMSTAVHLISSAATAIYNGATTSSLIGGAFRSTIEVGKNVIIASKKTMDLSTNRIRSSVVSAPLQEREAASANNHTSSIQKINMEKDNEIFLSSSSSSHTNDDELAIGKVSDSTAQNVDIKNNNTLSNTIIPSMTSKINPRSTFNLPLPSSRKPISILATSTSRDPVKLDSDSTTLSTDNSKKISNITGKFRLPPPLQIQASSTKEGLFRTPDRNINMINRNLGLSPLTPTNNQRSIDVIVGDQSTSSSYMVDHPIAHLNENKSSVNEVNLEYSTLRMRSSTIVEETHFHPARQLENAAYVQDSSLSLLHHAVNESIVNDVSLSIEGKADDHDNNMILDQSAAISEMTTEDAGGITTEVSSVIQTSSHGSGSKESIIFSELLDSSKNRSHDCLSLTVNEISTPRQDISCDVIVHTRAEEDQQNESVVFIDDTHILDMVSQENTNILASIGDTDFVRGSTHSPEANEIRAPVGWIELLDSKSGQPYYFNEAEGITSWDRPLSLRVNEGNTGTKETTYDVDMIANDQCALNDTVDSSAECHVAGIMSQEQADPFDSLCENSTVAAVSTQVEYMDHDELPVGWIEVWDPSSGCAFYYNETEGITSWDRPHSLHIEESRAESKDATCEGMIELLVADEHLIVQKLGSISELEINLVEAHDDTDQNQLHALYSEEEIVPKDKISLTNELAAGWVELLDPSSGRSYYFHEADGISCWDMPLSQHVTKTHAESNDVAIGPSTNHQIILDASIVTTVDNPTVDMDSDEQSREFYIVVGNDAAGCATRAEGVHYDSLAAGWLELLDSSSGQRYYYNEVEGITTWDKPLLLHVNNVPLEESNDTIYHEAIAGSVVHNGDSVKVRTSNMASLEESGAFAYDEKIGDTDTHSTVIDANHMNYDQPLCAGWIELLDSTSGRPYYYNEADGSISWDIPLLLAVNEIPAVLEATECEDVIIMGVISDEQLVTQESGGESVNALVKTHNPDMIQKVQSDAFEEQGEIFSADGADVVSISCVGENYYGELPEGWLELFDSSSGRPYYFNEVEGITSWDKPIKMYGYELNVIETNVDVGRIDSMGGTLADGLPTGNNVSVKPADVYIQTHTVEMTSDVEQETLVTFETETKASDNTYQHGANIIGDKLALGWTELLDSSSGRSYYYNEAEGITSWDRPIPLLTNEMRVMGDVSMTSIVHRARDELIETLDNTNVIDIVHQEVPEVKDYYEDKRISTDGLDLLSDIVEVEQINHYSELPAGWKELVDSSSGRPYYYNEAEGNTSWDRPVPLTESEMSVNIRDTTCDAIVNMITEGSISAKKAGDIKMDPLTEAPPSDIVSRDLSNASDHEEETIYPGGLSVFRKGEQTNVLYDLPVGWIELLDTSSGRSYYFNETEGVTSWDRPLLSPETSLHIDAALVVDTVSSRKFVDFRPRPGHAIASFGFGGRLCVMIPKTAEKLTAGPGSFLANINAPCLRRGPLFIWSTHQLLHDSFTTFNHIHPFIFSEDKEVFAFLDSKVQNGDTDLDMLWKLISIAAKFKGRLRSSSGSSTDSTPESTIVNILISDRGFGGKLLCENLYRDEKHEDSKDVGLCLSAIQNSLLLGKREEAVHAALSSKVYCVALLLSCVCDMATFKIAARTYIENELSFGTPLYTMCMLIANDVLPSSTSSDSVNLQEYWKNIPEDTLAASWRYHLAAILSNQMKGWKEVIIALGDTLLTHGFIEASHFCFMVGGCPISSSRFSLIGCDHSIDMHYNLMTDIGIESFILTEAFEWAKRKGNPQAIISSLQPLKLLYSSILADLGYCTQALEFLRSIKSCLLLDGIEKNLKTKKSSSLISSVSKRFLQEVDVMEDRLLLLIGQRDISTDLNVSSLQKPFPKFKSTYKGISMSFSKGETISFNPPTPPEVQYGEISSSSPLLEEIFAKPGGMMNELKIKLETDKDHSAALSHKDHSAALSHGHSFSTLKNDTNDTSNLRRPVSAPVIGEKDLSESPERNFLQAKLTDTNGQPLLIKSPSTAPLSIKAIAQPSASKQIPKSPDSAPSSGKKSKGWAISDWLTKKLNPDATKADIGERMEAYFDEKLKRWVFPGDDLTEIAKPLPPPPTSVIQDISSQESTSSSEKQVNGVIDPLSSLLAPPSFRGLKKGTVSSSSIASQNPAIPQFSVFQAKGDDMNTKGTIS